MDFIYNIYNSISIVKTKLIDISELLDYQTNTQLFISGKVINYNSKRGTPKELQKKLWQCLIQDSSRKYLFQHLMVLFTDGQRYLDDQGPLWRQTCMINRHAKTDAIKSRMNTYFRYSLKKFWTNIFQQVLHQFICILRQLDIQKEKGQNITSLVSSHVQRHQGKRILKGWTHGRRVQQTQVLSHSYNMQSKRELKSRCLVSMVTKVQYIDSVGT